MLLFTEIFIEPEQQRIEMLKQKEKEFSNLVLNVVNDQYDKILGVENPNKELQRKKALTVTELGGSRIRPLSSISKTTFAINE